MDPSGTSCTVSGNFIDCESTAPRGDSFDWGNDEIGDFDTGDFGADIQAELQAELNAATYSANLRAAQTAGGRQDQKPAYCSSPLYRLGTIVDNVGQVGQFVGKTGVTAGLGGAAIGGIATAPAGGEGALPGLALAGISAQLYGAAGFISTGGNVLKGIAGGSSSWSSVVGDVFSSAMNSMAEMSPIGAAVTGSVSSAITDSFKAPDPCK